MCHLQKVDDALVDGCGILKHFHSFSEAKCLHGYSKILWMGIEILWLFSVAAEDSIVVVLVTNLEDPSTGPVGSQFSILVLSNLCSVAVEAFVVLVVDSWEQCLLLRLKSRCAWGASRHPAFMGNYPTISHTCYRYLAT